MKDWNRKQFEKQKKQIVNSSRSKSIKEEKAIGYPLNYYPGKFIPLEEAQAIERYELLHSGTGDSRGVWKNRYGETVAFSY